MAQDARTAILFITNSESGQANTILALVAELLSRPDMEVHVASFAALEKRVTALRDHILSQPSSSSLTFHAIDGVDMNTALRQRGIRDEDLIHSPTTESYKAYDIAGAIVAAWSGEGMAHFSHRRSHSGNPRSQDYLQIVGSCKDIIKTMGPDLTVIDYLFNPARDAAAGLDVPYILSNPSSALDIIGTDHPRLKFFWYYPAYVLSSRPIQSPSSSHVKCSPLTRFGSGLPFPIPRRKIWKNIKMRLRMLYSYLTAREISTLVKHRNSHGIFGRLPHETPLRKATEVISPGIVDLDFPFEKPSNLRLYGPIVLDNVSVRDLDPQLSDWLDAGSTLLMTMGTHFTYTKAQVRAVLRGFLTALDPETRVLWKLPQHFSFRDVIDGLLPRIEDKERFKILDWIPVDPFPIMSHRNVVALVHHGGANTYYEAAL